MEEKIVVKRLTLPEMGQMRGCGNLKNEYDLTLRRTDRNAPYTFYEISGVGDDV